MILSFEGKKELNKPMFREVFNISVVFGKREQNETL